MTKTKIPAVRRWVRAISVMTIIMAAVGWLFLPPVYRLPEGPITVKRWTKTKGETEAVVGPKEPGWTHLQKVSRHVIHAIVAAEDGKFYQHDGIDLEELLHSLEINWRKKAYVRGGSTLTQQVVKMALLSRDKNLIRKLRELCGAVILEWILTKDQILEWYVNLAEFGDNVYGIQEAAHHYFRTKPELLTVSDAIHLALVLPSPNGWSVGLRRRNLTAFGHRRFSSIAQRMRRSDYITEEQLRLILATGNFGNPIEGTVTKEAPVLESGCEDTECLSVDLMEQQEGDSQGNEPTDSVGEPGPGTQSGEGSESHGQSHDDANQTVPES